MEDWGSRKKEKGKRQSIRKRDIVWSERSLSKGRGLETSCFAMCRQDVLPRIWDTGSVLTGQEQLAVNIHSKKGMYFMDMDLGVPITEKGNYKVYQEKEKEYT